MSFLDEFAHYSHTNEREVSITMYLSIQGKNGGLAPRHCQICQARQIFLSAIAKLAPEVLKGLKTEVFPHYHNFTNSYPDEKLINRGWVRLKRKEDHKSLALKEKLEEWAKSFRLSEEHFYIPEDMPKGKFDERVIAKHWFLDIALGTMNDLQEVKDHPDEHWSPNWSPIVGSYSLSPARGSFEWEWRYDNESLKEVKERILREFETNLNSQLSKVCNDNSLWIPAEEKRKKEHFEWIVEWHIKNCEYDELEEKYHRCKRTIVDGMNATADLMALTLRKNSRGRPKKEEGSLEQPKKENPLVEDLKK